MMREPTQREIETFARQNLKVIKTTKERSGPHFLCDCPICGKGQKFYMNENSGQWDCKVCGAVGNLWSLATQMGVRIREQTIIKGAASAIAMAIGNTKQTKTIEAPKKPRDAPGRNLNSTLINCKAIADKNDSAGFQVKTYLKARGFTGETIKHFRIGRTMMRTDNGEEPAVQIPYIVDDKVILTKERNLATNKRDRQFRRSKGAESPLFNGEAVKNRTQVVLVEGEFDAMSLWQAGITNVASTSTGAKEKMPEEWLEVLAGADDIVLWYDDDEVGESAVAALRTQLGTYRCRVASMPSTPEGLMAIGVDGAVLSEGFTPNDANDLLRAGVGFEGFKKIIDDAMHIEDGGMVEPSHYAEQIDNLFEDSETHLGVQFDHGVVTELLRGLRPELTLITGHTGHGKSTWALDHLMALTEQTGAPVMLTSYENGPMALARKIFQRTFGRPISSIKTENDKAAAREALQSFKSMQNIWIVDKYGDSNLDEVCDNIRYAVHRYGVKAVMLDHLEFILPTQAGFVKTHELINKALKELLKLCVELQVAIFVIAHPNGGITEKELPAGDNVKGSSGIKQLVENGISVYRYRRAYGEDISPKEVTIKGPTGPIRVHLGHTDTFVKVWKKRHDEANEGDGVYIFDRASLRYSDPNAVPAEPDPQQDLPYEDAPYGETAEFNW